MVRAPLPLELFRSWAVIIEETASLGSFELRGPECPLYGAKACPLDGERASVVLPLSHPGR